MKKIMATLIFIIFSVAPAWAEAPVEFSPSNSYDRYIIFESLALFWAGIIGLIVIIRMKLKEIERIQSLGIDEEQKDAPLLE
jgi:hypothetical protein